MSTLGGPFAGRDPRLARWAHLGGVFMGYAALTQVGLLLIPPDGVSSFWPAAGFAAVMVLWARTPRDRAATVASVTLSYLSMVLLSRSYGLAEIGFTVANALEPVFMLPFLIRATRVDRKLTNLASLGWLLLGAAVAPLLSGLIATTWTVLISHSQPWAELWGQWWAGDALGILVVAPVLLQGRPMRNLWSLGRPWEQAMVWLVFAGSVAQLVAGPSLGALALAGLVLVGLRLDTAAASLAALVTATVMAALALDPDSAFVTTGAGAAIDPRLLILITVVTGQLVALGTSARRRATADRDVALTGAQAARDEAETARARLAESETTLRQALDSGHDSFAIYEPDATGGWRLVFVNAEGARPAGRPAEELVGTPLADVVPVEALAEVVDLIAAAVRSETPQRTIANLRDPGASWHGDFDITVSPTPDGRVVVAWRDITEEHMAFRQLRAAHAAAMHAATHDPLTNLPNRMLLRDRLQTSIAALARSDHKIAVVFVDLDDFKAVNDRLGHLAGDHLLMETAQRLQALVRGSDSVARLGGDEFVLLLPGIDDEWDATRFHARLAAAIGQPIAFADQSVAVRASVGVVIVDAHGPSDDDILHKADVAMYRSKTTGKGRLTVWSEALADLPHADRIQPGELVDALATGQFFLAYQPVFDLRTDTVVGQEALLQWRHPRLGVLAHDEFIGLADDTGLCVEIGRWAVDRAVADLSRVRPGTWISLNVSPAHFVRRDVAADLLDSRNGGVTIDERLILELSEGLLLEATPAVLERMQDVRNLGVRIAIDDFGAGHSSLAFLDSLPVDVIKLDRDLISGAPSPRKARLMSWIGELSDTVDAMTIVEGVETPEQLALARSSGLDLAQGTLLGRPRELAAPGAPETGESG